MTVQFTIWKITGDRLIELNNKLSDIITKALDAKSMRGQRVEKIVWKMHGPDDVAANFRFLKIKLNVFSCSRFSCFTNMENTIKFMKTKPFS